MQSIKEQEPILLPFTFILDDASPVKDLDWVKEFGCHVLWKKENNGYSKVINMGLKFAESKGFDSALILNNDIELKTPVIRTYDSILESDPDISIIGSLLYYPTGNVQHESVLINNDKSIEMFSYGTPNPFIGNCYAQVVTGAFQFIMLNRGLSYPTQYSLSYEDVHFCLKAWENGHHIFYTPDIYAIHHESATRGKVLGVKEFESFNTFKATHFEFDRIKQAIQDARASNSLFF